ncbi:glycosyltransferase family 39 protein, partial [candidate division KSB1 bacterium]|nr:glycosyltransferase family 39 protein [candidate division KSB1 bacterium]
MHVSQDQKKLPDWIVILPAALTVIILHLIAIKEFGYFRDELYYIACSDHLATGYVDQPPLSIWILKGIRVLFGDSLLAIRILPALSSGVFVFLTGLIAREFGAKKFAMSLASLAALAPLGNLFLFHVYSMNFIDSVLWPVLFLFIIRMIKTGDPKYWIGFGLVAGIGLLNKISILFFGFGLFFGLCLTKHRKYFLSKYLWMGVAVAALLFLPYVLWNATHDWAMLEFMHNARTYKMTHVNPSEFFMGQFIYNNPVNSIVWITGLFGLLFVKSIRPYRLFGWQFLAIYILFTIQSAKDYYLAAAYPVLFAAGAIIWEQWLKHKSGYVLKPILMLLILSSTLLLSPFTLPVLPVEKTVEFIRKSGIHGVAGENHEIGVLPQHYADMHGWEEMVKLFSDVSRNLSENEKPNCLIYVRNYGEAGAIDFFGKKYGLPKANCTHNNYYFWGPPAWDGDVAIIYGWSHSVEDNLEDLESLFETVEHVATF